MGGGSEQKQTLGTEDGGSLQSAESRLAAAGRGDQLLYSLAGSPETQVQEDLLGRKTCRAFKSKAMSALLLGMLGRGCLLLTLPLLPKTPLNHSLTKPPPFLSVALAEVVSKQPPHLDWLWSVVSPSLAILSLLSLLLWPLSANLSRQPSLVFSNSQPKVSLATRMILAVNILS